MVDTSFYKNNGPFDLRKIASITEALLEGNTNDSVLISNIATLEKAGSGEICFFYDKKMKDKAASIKASACITTKELAPLIPSDTVVLIAENPIPSKTCTASSSLR